MQRETPLRLLSAQFEWIGLSDEQGRPWYGISSEVEIDPTKTRLCQASFDI
jgi:hypothetical protein